MTTLPEEAVKAMPERIYAAKKTEGSNCVVSFDTPSLGYNVEYVRADLVPFLPVQGAVKKLEWVDADEGMCTKWRAAALGGHYELVDFGKGDPGFAVNFHWGRPLSFWFIQGDPDEWGPTGPKIFPTLEAAKAAAQADYERRIISALEPAASANELSGISGQLNLATDMGNPITDKTVKRRVADALESVWSSLDCDVEEIDRIISHLNRNGLLIVGIQRFKMMADAIQSAAAYLALSQPNSAEKLIADLDTALETEVGNPAIEPSAARELALEEGYRQGIEAAAQIAERPVIGFSDGAVEASRRIASSIRALSSPDHADAGKVEGDGWLPIESAPKDGTIVLLGWNDPDIEEIGAVAGWYEGGPADKCWYDQYHEPVTATHWMPLRPLPAAPASEGAE